MTILLSIKCHKSGGGWVLFMIYQMITVCFDRRMETIVNHRENTTLFGQTETSFLASEGRLQRLGLCRAPTAFEREGSLSWHTRPNVLRAHSKDRPHLIGFYKQGLL